VEFLRAKNVEKVRVEFGYVLDRDLAGKQQPPDEIVQLSDLEHLIKTGLEDGTIEWKRSSEFRFYPIGAELGFLLCNDADVHFASDDPALLAELGHEVSSSGIRVFDSGKII
jgi:hypothetical protein